MASQLVVPATFVAPVSYRIPKRWRIEVAFDKVARGYRIATSAPIATCAQIHVQALARQDASLTQRLMFELLDLGSDLTLPEASDKLTRSGLRPAMFEELLSFALAHPDLQREFPIIATGSLLTAGTDVNLAMLSSERNGTERSLRMLWLGFHWVGKGKFLAVRASP